MAEEKLNELSEEEFEKEVEGKEPILCLNIFEGNSGDTIYDLHVDADDEEAKLHLIQEAINYLEEMADTYST